MQLLLLGCELILETNLFLLALFRKFVLFFFERCNLVLDILQLGLHLLLLDLLGRNLSLQGGAFLSGTRYLRGQRLHLRLRRLQLLRAR